MTRGTRPCSIARRNTIWLPTSVQFAGFALGKVEQNQTKLAKEILERRT